MRSSILAAMIAASLCSGCAVQKTLTPIGGSRSDGTVTLAYEVGMFEKAIVDPQQAQAAASSRCTAWGYTDAEAFGGAESICQSHDAYGNCTSWQVKVMYQCTGASKPQ